MPSIPIPTIKLWKRKERSIICEVLTDDGRWIDKEMPVLNSFLADDGTRLAFLIDENNQYMAEDGNWHQLVTEKSIIPICLRETNMYQNGNNDKEELKKLADQIFKIRFKQAKAEQFSKAKQSESWNKFLWVVSIVCGTFLIIAAMNYFKGG